MTHPNEEQLMDAYYSGLSAELNLHLETCSECRSIYGDISERLDAATDSPLPERSADYGAAVWARLRPHLPPQRSRSHRWLYASAIAALLPIVFMAGMWTERTRPQPITSVTRQLPSAPSEFSWPYVQPRPKPVSSRYRMPVLALPPHANLENFKEETKPHKVSAIAHSNSPATQKELLNSAPLSADTSTVLYILKQEKDPNLRASAVTTLATVPGRVAVLTTLYRTDTSDEVRHAVLDALVKQQNSRGLWDLANRETDLHRRSDILHCLYLLQSH